MRNIDFDVYRLFREYPDSRDFDIEYSGLYTFEPSGDLQFAEDFDPGKDIPCGISREIFNVLDDYENGEIFILEIIEAYRDFKKYEKEFNLEDDEFTRYYETSRGKMGIRNHPSCFGFVYLFDDLEYILMA